MKRRYRCEDVRVAPMLHVLRALNTQLCGGTTFRSFNCFVDHHFSDCCQLSSSHAAGKQGVGRGVLILTDDGLTSPPSTQ